MKMPKGFMQTKKAPYKKALLSFIPSKPTPFLNL